MTMAETASDIDRARMLLQLGKKISALLREEEALTDRIAEEGDPGVKRRLDEQLSETLAERVHCESRYSQIDAGGPFNEPGAGAEDALLQAIDDADRLVEGSAAAEELMAAFHRVVTAFPAG
jgi:hypothetical protein